MIAAVAEDVDPITEAQRACRTGLGCTAEDFFHKARWWIGARPLVSWFEALRQIRDGGA